MYLHVLVEVGWYSIPLKHHSENTVSCTPGENIEELFSRIAVVAFENVLMKEVEAEASPPPSNGQLAKNSTLIGRSYTRVYHRS